MAKNRYERDLEAIRQKMLEHVDAYKAIYKKADEEDRQATPEENEEIADHLKAIEVLKDRQKESKAGLDTYQSVDDLAKDLGPVGPTVNGGPRVGEEPMDRLLAGMGGSYAEYKQFQKSPGDLFVESAGFKSVSELRKQTGSLPQNTSTGQIALEAKGTLLEGAGGGGGGLAATVPQVVPGVVERQFQPLTIADLLLSGQATTNSIRYVVEGTATSGAAGVAEAAAKPQSTLGMTTTDEPVKKIATLLPISEEMLEDAPQVRAYINGRLTLFVRIEEERQLLRGAGTNEIIGIMPTGNTRGINIYAGGTAAGNKAEQLFKAMNGQRGSALVEPDFVVVSTSDWQDLRLLKDTAGQYLGGGPFQGQYGNNGQVTQSPQLVSNASIWDGTPVLVSSVLGAGTALVGTRSAAQVFRRGGLSVEASNSHSDYFALNLVAIRAEERLALAVYRPTAFTEVRLA